MIYSCRTMYFDVNFIWFQSINVSWNHEFLYVPVPQRFVALLALLSGNICDKEFDICAYYRFFRCDFVRDLIPIWLYSTLCMSVIYLLRIMIDRWHRYDVMHDACNYGGLHLFKHLDVGCKNPTNFNIICWVAVLMGRPSHWPRVPSIVFFS